MVSIKSLLLGPDKTKMKVFSEAVTSISTSVMASASTTASVEIKNVQNNDFTGNSHTEDSTFSQVASVNMSILQDASVNAEMQATIADKLASEIKSKKSDFPSFSETKTDTEVKSIIKRNVEASLSVSSVIELKHSIEQLQNNRVSRYASVSGVVAEQKATIISKVINKMSASIAQDLGMEGDIKAKHDEETFSFISDIIGTFSDGIEGVIDTAGGLFGLDDTTMIMIMVAIVAIAIVMSMSSGGQPQQMRGPPPQMYNPQPQQMYNQQPQQMYNQQPQQMRGPPQQQQMRGPPQQQYVGWGEVPSGLGTVQM